MLQRIIRSVVFTGAILSGLSVVSQAEYLPLDGSIKADETYRLLVRNLNEMASNIAYATSEQADSRMDSILDTIDGTFKGTRYVLKGQGSTQQKMNYLSSCGFFEMGLVLLNNPHTSIVWLACKQINVLFVELESLISLGGLVDKLFEHSIVDRFAELALSDENSEMNKALTSRGIQVRQTDNTNTVKEEASKSILLITDESNNRQLDALVDLGALDVACHLARTLQPPDEDKILIALKAAKKLVSLPYQHSKLGEMTLFGSNSYKYAELCDALENYCQYIYHYCHYKGMGGWMVDLNNVGPAALLFIYLFLVVLPLSATLLLLWKRLLPTHNQNAPTQKKRNKKYFAKKNGYKNKNVQEPDKNKCSHCGKKGQTMKDCSKCKSAAYCSRECQLAHWPGHKDLCKMMSKLNKAEDKADVYTQIAKMGKKAEKQGNYSRLMMTHVGWVATDKEIPLGLPTNFLYIHEAAFKHTSLGKKRELGESLYKRLYDELVKNEEVWEDFFSHPENQRHILDTVMVLETLAGIYHARKNLDQCGLVLDIQSKILQYMKGHCEDGVASEEDTQHCKTYDYRLLNTRFDINEELQRYEDNVSIIRQLTAHDEERGHSHSYWKTIVRVWDEAAEAMQQNLSDKSVQDISDETVLQVYMHAIESEKRMRSACPDVFKIIEEVSGNTEANEKRLQYQKKVELLSCAHCNKKESTLGEHKKCGCNQVVYCSKKCQSLHWKKHKKECKKKK